MWKKKIYIYFLDFIFRFHRVHSRCVRVRLSKHKPLVPSSTNQRRRTAGFSRCVGLCPAEGECTGVRVARWSVGTPHAYRWGVIWRCVQYTGPDALPLSAGYWRSRRTEPRRRLSCWPTAPHWRHGPAADHRQTDRQTERDTDTDRQRETDTETNRHRQRDRHTERHRDRQRDRDTQTETETQTHTETDRHRDTDRHIDTDKDTQRQWDRDTDRQTHTQRQTVKSISGCSRRGLLQHTTPTPFTVSSLFHIQEHISIQKIYIYWYV